jgi:PAS domain S-box-containing protein
MELGEALADTRLVDLLPGIVYVFDLDENRSIYVNQATGVLLGHGPDRVVSPDYVAEKFHPDDAPALAAHLNRMRRLADGATASFEYRMRHQDGTWHWMLSRDVVLARHADGRVRQVLGVAIDITERKEAEQLLAKSEGELRTLFTSIDEGFCLCELIRDEQGRAVDFRFLSVNPLFDQMTGLREPVGRTLRELYPDIDSSWVEVFSRVGLDGETLRKEIQFPSDRWVELFSVPVLPRGRFAIVLRDQTERRRAMDALRENQTAERIARLRAERITVLLDELLSTEGAHRRVRRISEFLSEELEADHTLVEVPGSPRLRLACRSRVPAGSWQEDRSRITAPIDLGRGVRGLVVLRIVDPDREPFGPDDERFVHEVADRAGVVLARTQMREDEHKVSLRLQRALLPDSVCQHPDVEINAHYEAASLLMEVGGDWYDTFSWPDGHVGVMVGDVMGHDLQAAVAMGRLRAGVGALIAGSSPSPAAVLAALDRCSSGPDGSSFVTACAVVVDPGTGELRYSRAGHPPPLLVPPRGAATWLDGAVSPPVCDLEVGIRPEAVVRLAPGSVVVLFSDGLVERRGESIGDGMERLRRAAAELVRTAGPDLPSRLAVALNTESDPEDDIVAVTIRYRPTCPAHRAPTP